MLRPDVHYFPNSDDPAIAPFALAFIRMMFAHAELEARIRDLQNVLKDDPTFGEKIHPWTAQKRPKLMKDFIVEQCGSIPEADQIEDCLKGAIPLCDVRNHLAHGQWWAFDPNAGTITVRRGRIFEDEEEQHKKFSAADIEHVAAALRDTEAKLYKLEAVIKAQLKRDWY